jgi:general nucleoside transport system ATP-binding protein
MRVELQHIVKLFGTLRANDDISLTLEPGRIYGLLGENGAGKSTLMKVLSGFLEPKSGQILIDGAPRSLSTPEDAMQLGIGMLHQDPLDFPPLQVLENFSLGYPSGLGLDRRRLRRRLLDQATTLGFHVDPDAFVDRLTIGERQELEIVRLLALGVDLLILDEPTTGISAEQKHHLFQTLEHLAHEEGLTIVFVSHKLEEVVSLCDHAYVLRRGRLVGEAGMPTETCGLVELMFGAPLPPSGRPAPHVGDVALEFRNVSVRSHRLCLLDVCFEAHAGEVVGLAGLEGSGQSELLRACAGLLEPLSGTITVDGRPVVGAGYHTLLKEGIAYLPAGRLEEGLVTGLTIAEHVALVNGHGSPWLDWESAKAAARQSILAFAIQGEPDTPVEALSGGNQQRLALALLPRGLKVLLLEHPTRGLDVASSAWVWKALLERREEGTAIVFTSADLDEIMDRSDRIVVVAGGRASEPRDAGSVTVEDLGHLIAEVRQ